MLPAAGAPGKQTDKTATVAPTEGTQFAGRENSNAVNSVTTAKRGGGRFVGISPGWIVSARQRSNFA